MTVQGTPITELRSGVTRITSPELTMSSQEIADLVGSRHDKVMQSIERLAEKGVIRFPPMGEKSRSEGRPGKEYIFEGEKGKRDSIIAVAQLSPEFTAILVDRWQYLEAQVAKPVANLSDAAQLRGLLLGYTEQVLQLEAKIAEDAPKAKFHDQVAIAQNSHSMKQVADILKTGRNKLFSYLRKHGALLSDGINRNMPYQRHKEAGRFVVVETTRVHPKDESVVILDATTYVTGKGLIWIQQLIEQHGRAGL